MFTKFLDKFIGDWEPIPNKFTIGMGILIRNARKLKGMSQSDLSKSIFVRQASISDIENGKREVKSSELLYLSLALNKPISYFFPKQYQIQIDDEKFTSLQEELILLTNQMSDDDMKRLIAQSQALVNLNK